MPDIDIDFADRNKILSIIDHVPASRLENNEYKKHNTGVYCHSIPVNPLNSMAAIDYQTAEERGYFKIDFLNVSVYNDIRDEAHLERLMSTEPLWDLLLQDEFVDLLFHLNGHGDVLRKTKPTSVEQLAAVLAMIRPAKRHLIGKPWSDIMQEIWTKPTNGDYHFKKAHAVAYAVAVIVQINLICEKISWEFS